MLLESAFSLAILFEIFIPIGYFSRKQKWMFFSEHSIFYHILLRHTQAPIVIVSLFTFRPRPNDIK